MDYIDLIPRTVQELLDRGFISNLPSGFNPSSKLCAVSVRSSIIAYYSLSCGPIPATSAKTYQIVTFSPIEGRLSFVSTNNSQLTPTSDYTAIFPASDLPEVVYSPESQVYFTLLSVIFFIALIWFVWRMFIYPFYRRINK